MPNPPLRRGYNFEQTLYVPAPTGGWNPDANWWELPADQAAKLDNFIIRPGKIVSRGPFIQIADIASHTSQGIITGYSFADATFASTSPSGVVELWYKADDVTAFVDPWNAPLVNAPAANLAAALNAVDQVALDTGTVTAGAAPTIDKVGGPHWINFDGLLYGISYDSSGGVATDTNATYHMKPLNLLTLPVLQTPGTVPVPTVLANAPHGAFDLKGYQQRIWLLGGIDTPAGFTVHEPISLYYTVPGVSGVGTATADWRDPVKGTTNKLKMDNNNADFGVGLGVAPNALVVFRHTSVWVLRGRTSDSYQLQPISKEVGCIDARSIVETDRGIYFLSNRGLMFTDGSVVRFVGSNVQNQLAAAIGKFDLYLQTGIAQAGSYATANVTSDGQIYISIGISASTSPGVNPAYLTSMFTGLYDPTTGAWTRHTSNFWWPGASAKEPYLIVGRPGRQQLYSLGDGATQNCAVIQLENAAYKDAVNWGNSFLRQSNSQNGLVDFDLAHSSALIGIPWVWQTKLLPMTVNVRRKVQLKRIFVDYVFDSSDGSGSSFGLAPWQLQPTPVPDFSTPTPMDLAHHTSNPGQRIGNGPSLGTYGPGRLSANYAFEASDLFITIAAFGSPTGNLPGSAIAEIYGVGIEYQQTRDHDGGV